MYKGSKKDGNRSRKRLSKKQFLEAKKKSKNKSNDSQVKSKNNVVPKRLLIIEEPKDHEKLDAGKMMELTGCDTIVARSLTTPDKKEE